MLHPPNKNPPLSEVFLNKKKRAGEALFCEGEIASPSSRDVLCRMMLHPPIQNPPPSKVFSNRKKRKGEALFREKESASPPSRFVFSFPKNRHAEPAQQLFTLHFSFFTRLSHISALADSSLFTLHFSLFTRLSYASTIADSLYPLCEVNKITTLCHANLNNVKNR